MDFQIKPLPAADFAPLFALSDDALAARKACRMTVTETPGTPCRVSLQDAEIGERVILTNYMHQPGDSPYQSTHAVFVRENAMQAAPVVNEIPAVISTRLISLRLFDQIHMMVAADVIPGEEVADAISAAFTDAEIAYAHLHIAKPGCFAASAHRVD
ncbi:DUF1203 domain-containing protein [uncultured Roseobacter sp.]|uniref:DUF1203 domain-containing protein n=1 Tax=uncultured Roseobacter sp. TaxID=114847 RepID=UPI00261E0B92|nr:DUF1203 domain-containing protein [uncultured Roseobacter sp.]